MTRRKARIVFWLVLGLSCGTALTLWGAAFLVDPVPIREVSSLEGSPLVTDREGRPLWLGLTSDDRACRPISLDAMGRWLPLVAVEVEDRRFWRHAGVDWLGIVRAAWQNLTSGRVISGGSTITSQLVRLTRPRVRTVATKAVEFLQAMALERSLSKRRILELYLNKAPFGGTLVGVGAASLGWWGKEASDLSLAEAATLVAMLKGPTRYRPDLHPHRLKARRDMILKKLAHRSVVTAAEADLARAEPLPQAISRPGQEYLFVSQALKRRPQGGRSTLDAEVQRLLRRTVAEGLFRLPQEITAAAVVVDNETGAVRGYVGNGRFGERLPWGWVDCCNALRSPGSALKPFVYAMAFDDGTLSPSSLMADTPLSMSGRAPRNFDLRYRGAVSAARALADSLNVPAVRVLRMVGANRFLHRLRSLGFGYFVHDAEWYGDSLILGGCEVTLLELLKATMTLASWRDRPLSFFEDDRHDWRPSPISQEGSFLVGDILKNRGRLVPKLRALLSGNAEMALKTGTSYGLRDAWAVAWNRRWTVVVWFGDPLGTPHPELVGLSLAVPVATQIMTVLGGRMPEPPDGVARRTVCSLSGLPPTSACPHREEAWHIPTVSSSEPCSVHRWEEGRVVTVWPAQFGSSESRRVAEAELQIRSPLSGASYILPPWGEPPRVALACEGAQGDVSWFVDGVFFRTVSAGESLFWTAVQGRHRIAVVDRRGRSCRVTISVLPWGGGTDMP
ncbi:MAG: penicillin-binding protein 1C [Dethiosulfovibrio peptidovorans]|nr:MAG: penicillin-binding protein 1C [Dethiosulfovibrio peptidovorans]